jgi:phosphoribosylformylglycinamidine (FGAM) synthase-like amidotransferase family enzyme
MTTLSEVSENTTSQPTEEVHIVEKYVDISLQRWGRPTNSWTRRAMRGIVSVMKQICASMPHSTIEYSEAGPLHTFVDALMFNQVG